MLVRQLLVDGGEALGVAGAVVGWQAHAEQQHRGPLLPAAVDQRVQVALYQLQRQPAQAVIGTQFDDAVVRLVALQQAVQAAAGGAGGGAADAGIDHGVVVADTMQALLQQFDPALAGGHAVAGAEAVAEHQHDRRGYRRQAGKIQDDNDGE